MGGIVLINYEQVRKGPDLMEVILWQGRQTVKLAITIRCDVCHHWERTR